MTQNNSDRKSRQLVPRCTLALAALAAAACASKKPAEEEPQIPGAVPVSDVGFLLPESGGAPRNAASFAACAETRAQAEARAADMFIMLDHTGSMGNDCPLNLEGEPMGNSKWCYATHAFAEYFTSVAAQGNRAALQFMSGPDFVCDGGPNNGAARAAISLTDLPVEPTHPLITALDENGPTGGMGTQIEAALRGIADYTRDNETPGRTMIGVLATDGDPNGCEQNVGRLANIIEEHLVDTGIRTFVIGMTGASLNNLERMASVGGAPEHTDHCGGQNDCHFWSVGDGDPVAFVDALSQIEAAAVVPCSYSIPPPPSGELLDNSLVNVLFTAKSGTEFVISRVDACGGDTGGWAYDNPENPSLLTLCGATCEAVTAEGIGASLNIAYGCQSLIQ